MVPNVGGAGPSRVWEAIAGRAQQGKWVSTGIFFICSNNPNKKESLVHLLILIVKIIVIKLSLVPVTSFLFQQSCLLFFTIVKLSQLGTILGEIPFHPSKVRLSLVSCRTAAVFISLYSPQHQNRMFSASLLTVEDQVSAIKGQRISGQVTCDWNAWIWTWCNKREHFQSWQTAVKL